MKIIRRKISKIGPNLRILDAGCGEGVLVEEFRNKGFQIEGLDLNYESSFVHRGSVLDMPYEDGVFDSVILLDVFEHLGYGEQPVALAEIHRVLKPEGKLIASIPNLAHMNSRFRMMFHGQLDRTDVEKNHIGERPFTENWKLLTQTGFRIEEIKGVTITIPILYRQVICRRPAWFRWLHDLLEPFATPSLSMIDIFVCRRL